MFDPKAHLIQLPRRVKDPATGQWVTRQDEYLEVKWRLVWFREKYPHGTIATEEMCVDLDQGYARFKATVSDGEGGMATGTGTEMRKSFEDFVEKAETRSIGRALAALGIGTQFVGEELSEGDHIADSPVATPHERNAHEERPSSVAVDATTVAKPPAAFAHPQRPTADEIATLVQSAQAANVDLEAFGHDMRRLMQLPETQKITKKFLRETMTMDQYHQARKIYGDRLAAILAEDVPDHGSAPTHDQPDASAAAPTPPPEAAAGPFGSSSSAPEAAPAADPADADRDKLRREVATWPVRVSEHEVEHIISHHPYAKARALLWKARLQPNGAALVAD
jgi:hypothetical protein